MTIKTIKSLFFYSNILAYGDLSNISLCIDVL